MSTVLERWHAIVKDRDVKGLRALLHADAVFESPVLHTPQKGGDVTFGYLNAALDVLANDSFTYVGEWRAGNSAVLEFKTEVQGVKINGVDIVTWNDDGEITHFKVMIRPLKAINLLHQLMAARLAKG